MTTDLAAYSDYELRAELGHREDLRRQCVRSCEDLLSPDMTLGETVRALSRACIVDPNTTICMGVAITLCNRRISLPNGLTLEHDGPPSVLLRYGDAEWTLNNTECWVSDHLLRDTLAAIRKDGLENDEQDP